MKMNSEIKAMLLEVGSVDIDESLIKTTRSTAGPDAGSISVFFRSGGHRVRLEIDKKSPLKAIKDDGEIVILNNGMEIARGFLEKAPSHCPEQAYITISECCIYDCKFCPVPKLNGKIKTINEIISIVEMARKTGNMKAISLTTGVAKSPEDEVERVAKVVMELKRYGVPIGVSVCPTKNSSEILKSAGADEIKYNVETMDPDIYKEVVHKGIPLDFILNSLENAVEVFGKNKVYSNFIIGMGETDEAVEKGVKKLTSIGVIPLLRPINIHPLRKNEIKATRPSAKRLLKLALITRKAMYKHGFRTDLSKTMCLSCAGCDLTLKV
ncbi:MAG: radical SAM protein [Methanosarcinales archaeon]